MQIAQLIEKIYTRPRLRISMHVLFWLFLFGIKLYLTYVSFNVYRGFPGIAFTLIILSNTLLIAAFYYCLVYAVIPVIVKRKYFRAGLFVLMMFISYNIADSYSEVQLVTNCEGCLTTLSTNNPTYAAYLDRGFINVMLTRLVSLGFLLLLAFALSIPLSIKLALQAYHDRIRSLQLAKDNLQLEFNFLKAQLNPHFLFNSMNNIYGLIMSGDKDRSAALVARLSELLRYTLYDSNQETMPVEREIKLIQDYIELEKIRLNDTKVSFDYSIDHHDYYIAPLLLMPLIENAFKYCGDTPASFIAVFIDILNGKLRVTIDNSIDAGRTAQITGGIGLSNFNKRMDLYYPGKYWYEAGVSGDSYSVILTIQL